MEIAEVKEQADKICENISRVLIGREKEIRVILAALFAGGHVLVEDRPGTGKTLLAKTFAKSIGGQFKRVQFTPDLMPSDITGLSICIRSVFYYFKTDIRSTVRFWHIWKFRFRKKRCAIPRCQMQSMVRASGRQVV